MKAKMNYAKKYDEKHDIYSLKIFPPKTLIDLKGKTNGYLTMEKLDRHHLNQVMKVNITSSKSY